MWQHMTSDGWGVVNGSGIKKRYDNMTLISGIRKECGTR